MTSPMKRASQIVLGAVIFVAGIAAGSLHARRSPVQNRFGQPKKVLHVVVYKFKDTVSNNDREKAINGIKDMAGKIPGIKNVWLKTARNQIKDFSGVYAIESGHPKARYTVTPLAKWAAFGRRVLPDTLMDSFLRRKFGIVREEED